MCVLVVLGVLGLAGFWGAAQSPQVSALEGFGPTEFVLHAEHPETMEADFPGGTAPYRVSLPHQGIRLAYRWFDMAPERSRQILILLEFLFTAIAATYMARVMAPRSSVLVVTVFVLVFTSSAIRTSDLGRWDGPLYWGSHYALAGAFGTAGIVAILRRRWVASAVLLAIGATTHLTVGLYANFFVLAIVAVRWRELKQQDTVIRAGTAALIYAVVMGLWLGLTFNWDAVMGGTVSDETWVAYSWAFNFHFFPAAMGLFWGAHQRFIFFVTVACLGVHYMVQLRGQLAPYHREIAAGMATIALITLVGVLVSIWTQNATLLKLAMPRASSLILIFASLYIVFGLVTDLLAGKSLRAGVAFLALASTFFSGGGIPYILAVAVVAPTLLQKLRNRMTLEPLDWIVPVGLLGVGVLLGTYAAAGVLKEYNEGAYTGIATISEAPSIVRIAIIGVVAVIYVAKQLRRPSEVLQLSACVLGCAVMAGSWHYNRLFFPDAASLSRAEAYEEVQDWARWETSPGTLFMPDPTHYYGWRAISRRPSFGNLREWLHTGWMYESRQEVLDDGIERLAMFGFSPSDWLGRDEPLAGYFELHSALREKYYSMSRDEWSAIRAKYGVRYAVFERERMTQTPNVPVVYRNEKFLVGELPSVATLAPQD